MTTVATVPAHVRRDRFDPAPELARIRAQTPLTRIDLGQAGSGPTWLAIGYAEVREVLGAVGRFSTLPPADNRGDSRQLVRPGNLLQHDPPEHTRLRKLLTPEFTVRRMRRLAPRIEAIVAERLDVMEQAGPPADLMTSFAWPIPALATCELLGVPRDDRGELARHLDTHRDAGRGRRQQLAAGRALDSYMAALTADQRERPGEDMLGMLVREHGRELADEELAGLGTFLLGAGFDNMASMIGLGVLLLLEHPGQLAELRQRPAMMDHAIEEMLRHLTVIHTASPRTAVAEITIAGQRIAPGDRVLCSLLAANRDGALAAQPDRLDLAREPTSHVAFGHGAHHCLGAPLARMELRIAFQGLLRRFPGLRLAAPRDEVRFRPAHSRSYGVESLPVAW